MDIRRQIFQYLKSTPARGIEESALALLASRTADADPGPLIRAQRRSGGWSEFANVGAPSAFHTSLALLSLRPFSKFSHSAADSGFRWLAGLRGRESHWLWQWKFRRFDRQVRFDPSKSGWPWIPGTVSWVAPTALSMLAHRAWHRNSSRLASATAMLLDRACVQGGWNAGNSVVFGVALEPQPDFTAMALLALRSSFDAKQPFVNRSLDYLADRFEVSLAPYSLAWASIALSAYHHPSVGNLKRRLEAATKLNLSELPVRTLALVALALEEPTFTFWEGA